MLFVGLFCFLALEKMFLLLLFCSFDGISTIANFSIHLSSRFVHSSVPIHFWTCVGLRFAPVIVPINMLSVILTLCLPTQVLHRFSHVMMLPGVEEVRSM